MAARRGGGRALPGECGPAGPGAAPGGWFSPALQHRGIPRLLAPRAGREATRGLGTETRPGRFCRRRLWVWSSALCRLEKGHWLPRLGQGPPSAGTRASPVPPAALGRSGRPPLVAAAGSSSIPCGIFSRWPSSPARLPAPLSPPGRAPPPTNAPPRAGPALPGEGGCCGAGASGARRRRLARDGPEGARGCWRSAARGGTATNAKPAALARSGRAGARVALPGLRGGGGEAVPAARAAAAQFSAAAPIYKWGVLRAYRRKCWLALFHRSVSAPLYSFPFLSLLALSASATQGGRITGHGSGARLRLPGGSGSVPPLRPAPAYFSPVLLGDCRPPRFRGPGEVRPRGAAQVRLQRGPPGGAFPLRWGVTASAGPTWVFGVFDIERYGNCILQYVAVVWFCFFFSFSIWMNSDTVFDMCKMRYSSLSCTRSAFVLHYEHELSWDF